MNENIHAIIHKSFTDLSGLVSFWDTQCKAIAVAEHSADSEVPRTHCHFLIIEPIKKKNAFNEDLKKFFPGINGREDFRLNLTTQKSKEPISRSGLWYLIKGNKELLKFSKDFSTQDIEDAIKVYDPGKFIKEANKEKKEKKLNRFEIVEKIRDKVVNMSDNKDIWNIMIQTLQEEKIMTGVFDLERWFVTIKLTDKDVSDALRHKIISKLYS